MMFVNYCSTSIFKCCSFYFHQWRCSICQWLPVCTLWWRNFD